MSRAARFEFFFKKLVFKMSTNQRKRKFSVDEPTRVMSPCATEIQTFLSGGMGGFETLRRSWRSIKTHYHDGDEEGWRLSCDQAMQDYNSQMPAILQGAGYELDKLPWDCLIHVDEGMEAE